ncbi:MAG: hypothetical protein CL917_14480 [Deltaproteobacteria bacterium]|nr:hypothetical protein [Deltaproteobacteria bacterium]
MTQAVRKHSDRVQRRSHAERTAETRRKIIDAVVDSISDVGFQNTTAAEIVRRAGVTWGAAQHHFGDKDGILIAVLEDSFGHFARRLDDINQKGTSLEKRIDLFIDRAWEHFGGAEYRSTFEILLNFAGSDQSQPESVWQSEMSQAWQRIWTRIFSDVQIKRQRARLLQQYTVSVLTGLASTQMLGKANTQDNLDQLKLVKDTLYRELRDQSKK